MTTKNNAQDIPDFIPSWFHTEVVSWGESRSADREEGYPLFLDEVERNAHLLLFTNNVDMRKAWVSLDKHYQKAKSDSSLDSNLVLRFPGVFPMMVCGRAAMGGFLPDKLTNSERIKTLTEIEYHAQALRKLLNQSGMNYPVHIWLHRLGMNFLKDDMENCHSQIAKGLKIDIGQIVEEIPRFAERYYSEKSIVLKKPGAPDARKLYFCRVVTGFFKEYLGSPLYAATASIGTCILGEDIDSEYVRFAAKNHPGV